MLRRAIIRILANFAGLWAAVAIFPGVTIDGRKIPVLIVAAIVFSIVNYAIRPLVIILSLPAIILTLGLFTLVINTFMLYLTSFFVKGLDIKNYRSALGAVIIVWFVNFVINWLTDAKKPDEALA